MSANQPRDVDGTLVAERSSALNIPDLDAMFGLKIRSMLTASIPLMYEDFVRNVDVAAMRGRGLASVVSYAAFRRFGGPLAVGAPLRTRVETRHSELSGDGLGARTSRLGFECRFSFDSPLGTGDPRRYRKVVTDQPQPCGAGQLILTLVRPAAPLAERLVAEPPEETRHLDVHVLDPPHPSVDSLSVVAPEYIPVESPAVERQGVFGPQHTDVNQYVYTGEYTAVIEDYATLLVAGSGLPTSQHRINCVAAVFKSPFAAGDGYALRGALYRDGDRSVALVGVHPVTPDGPTKRPAVFGRVESSSLPSTARA